MKRLTRYSKNGYQFELINRKGLNAIFLGTKTGSQSLNYEVVRLREVMEGSRIVRDKVSGTESKINWEAHESTPGDNEWGVRGWTYSTLLEAEAKLESITMNSARLK